MPGLAWANASNPVDSGLFSMFSALPRLVSILLLLSLTLGGCATTGEYADANDPFEGFNRSIYNFNEKVDRYVLKPVAEGYVEVTPTPVQRGIGNFFNNLEDIGSAANNLLQMKVGRTLSDLSRVLINSTLGLGGLFDVASTANIPRYEEDFGQTLGYWGFGPGPYLVLPLLGPSSVRDTLGLVGDIYLDPLGQLDEESVRMALKGVEIVDVRAGLLGASNMLDMAALDPYAFTRDAYLQRRLSKVYDGNPPLDLDF
jgi:phospholipid-binding lipoprotein MlaA